MTSDGPSTSFNDVEEFVERVRRELELELTRYFVSGSTALDVEEFVERVRRELELKELTRYFVSGSTALLDPSHFRTILRSKGWVEAKGKQLLQLNQIKYQVGQELTVLTEAFETIRRRIGETIRGGSITVGSDIQDLTEALETIDRLKETIVQSCARVLMREALNDWTSQMIKPLQSLKSCLSETTSLCGALRIYIVTESLGKSERELDDLSELVEAAECYGGKTLLPIFYGVDPSDVRNQTGPFAEPFAEYEVKYKDDPYKVERWRGALRTLGNLAGWVSKGRREEQLIEEIVKETNQTIRKLNFYLSISARTNVPSAHSFSSCGEKHDVFLSFSGEDTRLTFVDHLYGALKRRQISTFKDDISLRKGMEIDEHLKKAIVRSKVWVVIVSPNYASSEWCMNELLKIIQCREASKVAKKKGTVMKASSVNAGETHKGKASLPNKENVTSHNKRAIRLGVNYGGKWVGSVYAGGKTAEIVVSDDITYNELLDQLYHIVGVHLNGNGIKISTIDVSKSPDHPVEIINDDDLRTFIHQGLLEESHLKKRYSCASMEEEYSCADNEHGEQSVPSTRKRKAAVWDNFEVRMIRGEEKTICKHCGRFLSAKAGHGTNSLNFHVKSCKGLHPKPARSDGATSAGQFDKAHESNARTELANMIIMHEYPLSMVEHLGFKRYSNALQPSFKVPSRNTIKKEIMKIYEFEKEKTMKLLQMNTSRIAITTDMWTASNLKKGFMAITSHFIDESWNLQSRLLRFVYVPCPHDADTLHKVLMECLYSWKIHRKLSTLTVDNCTTNDAIIDLLLVSLRSSSLLVGGKLFHMRCASHILNLIMKDGLDVIRESIETIRSSVAYWTGGPKREEMFAKVARQMGVGYNRKLALDCRTRWNSTFLMLQAAVPYKTVFPALKTGGYKDVPSEDEWNLVMEIADKLQIFYKAIELLSGTKYPTSNLLFSKICQIKLSISKWLESDIDEVKEMAKKMEEKLEKYWGVIGTIAVATILDPRYKLKLIEFYFRQIYPHRAALEVERVKKLAFDLAREYRPSTVSHVADNSSLLEISRASDDDLRDADMDAYDAYVAGSSMNNDKSDLERYLDEPVLPRINDRDFDILYWWKTSGMKYLTLYKVARDILAIPVSTVASESAFSNGGRIVSPHRNRLHSNTIEALMCGRDWLHSQLLDVYGTLDDDTDVDEDSSLGSDTDSTPLHMKPADISRAQSSPLF